MEGFSPRNGEVILKKKSKNDIYDIKSFSPRNGEVILKTFISNFVVEGGECFSPRNGEVILKF